MAHYTLIARINAGNGRFPFVNVQFTKTHRPIPIAGATYYLRRSGGARTPIRIGKDLAAAHAALLHMDDREVPNEVREVTLGKPSHTLTTAQPSISLPRAANGFSIVRLRRRRYSAGIISTARPFRPVSSGTRGPVGNPTGNA